MFQSIRLATQWAFHHGPSSKHQSHHVFEEWARKHVDSKWDWRFTTSSNTARNETTGLNPLGRLSQYAERPSSSLFKKKEERRKTNAAGNDVQTSDTVEMFAEKRETFVILP